MRIERASEFGILSVSHGIDGIGDRDASVGRKRWPQALAASVGVEAEVMIDNHRLES
jgi:hypothetical protein